MLHPHAPPTPPNPACSSLIEAVVASGVLPRLVSLMGHSELVVVVPALRVTGNVISGTERHTQAALDAGALRFITPLLGHSKRNVRREACWTVSNVAAGTQPQISAMLSTPGLSSAVLQQLKHGDWNVKKEVRARSTTRKPEPGSLSALLPLSSSSAGGLGRRKRRHDGDRRPREAPRLDRCHRAARRDA